MEHKHLVLHFDVNKTLVMVDPAGGKGSVEVMLNDMISELAYGTVAEGGNWLAATDQLGSTVSPPAGCKHAPPLTNYYDYLVRKHPTDKARRNQLRASFTLAGERFRVHYEALLHAMRDEGRNTPDDTNDPAGAPTSGGPRYHYIVPSFLHLLKHLKESGRTFTLVFRTFGQDLPHLTKHFDEFCEGRHPQFRGFVMDGSDGKPDYRIQHKVSQHGAFFRHGKEKHETHLAMGLWDQVRPATNIEEWRKGNKTTIDFYEGRENVKLLSGFDAIHDYIHTAGQCTLALLDYFPWWRANFDAAYAGKLFTLDQTETSVHPLFFDDNIYLNGSQPEWMNIVDPRARGTPLPHRDLLGRHLVKVEPADVIRDLDYFVRSVAAALAAAPS